MFREGCKERVGPLRVAIQGRGSEADGNLMDGSLAHHTGEGELHPHAISRSLQGGGGLRDVPVQVLKGAKLHQAAAAEERSHPAAVPCNRTAKRDLYLRFQW